jgi:hypothetical protein
MSMLAALAKRWNYSVTSPGAGRLLYREGNREYTFPIFQDHETTVLVGVPSSQRVHLFFNWYAQPQEFSTAARDRIVPRIEEHLRSRGVRVRVFERDETAGNFSFHPELLASRDRAIEFLDAAGCEWFTDYSSIDLLHAEYGLEVGGIQKDSDVRTIAETLQQGFPHWHHQNVCVHDHGREPGWTVALCMFPAAQ